MELSTKLFRSRYCRWGVVCFLICFLFFNGLVSDVIAGPEGAQVVNGQVSIQQSGSNTAITASDKAIINYSSFNIAQPETVQFIQPGSSASVLNRILSANPTNINGTLLANGRVFFVNPAGVYIGAGARINVNQLVASGLNISNADFINGRYNFAGGNGAVINNGDISAQQVYLIGKQVTNSGNISCPAGYVVMASGDRVFLGEPGSDIVLDVEGTSLSESANAAVPEVAVLNEGTIEAAGGIIALAAAGDIYSQAISNVGALSASVDTGDAGQIKLTAADGTVINSGTIEAKSSSGTGGTVQMLGDKVGLFDAGRIDVSGSDGGGTVLVGGDFQGKGDVLTASRTYVGPDASIIADATENGDGGKVIVWADEITRFYGDISVRGGSEGGDGGFVEVSGKENLGFYGYVDALAPKGNVGSLLLDPDELNITAATGTENGELASPGDPTIAFTDDPGGDGIVDITAAHLVSELNLADITLQANNQIDVETAVDASGNANSHALELDSTTINFSNGADITLNAANLTIGNTKAGNVVLLDGATVALSTGDATAGDISIAGTVSGTGGGGNEHLSLISGSGTTTVTGAVGAGGGIGTLTLQADNASATGAVTFNGAVTADTITTYAQAYAVTLQGASNVINSNTSFLNTGLTTIGNESSDSSTFTGGLDATSAGGVSIAGIVATTDTQMDLGATTLTTDSTLKSGSGAINVASLGGAFTLSLQDALAASTGNVAVAGDATITGLTTFGGAADYDVALNGGGTITNDTTFANVGAITLGDGAGDSLTFTGGLDTTSGSGTSVAGTVATTDTQMDLGATTLTTDSTLKSGSGAINVASLGGAFTLSLQDALAASTGNVAVAGDATITGLTTFGGAADYDVALNGGGTITNDTTFANVGAITLGDGAGDSLTFTGGLDTTSGSGTNIAGTVATTAQDIDLGTTILTAGSTLTTGAGAGNITFQSTLNGAQTLGLTPDTGDINFNGIVGGSTPLGNVTINSAADVYMNAAFNANDITITANSTATNNVTAAGGLTLISTTTVADGSTLRAGTNLSVGPSLTGLGDLTLVATAGGITANTIDMSVDDHTLSLTQNNTIDMADFSVINYEDTDLVLNSTGGSSIVTGSAADNWQSIAATALYNVVLSGDGDITTGNLDAGSGVQISTDTGSGGSLIAQGTIDSGGSVTVNVEGNAGFTQTVSAGGNIDLKTVGNITANMITTAGNIGIESTTGNLILNGGLTATAGGVSLISRTGKIYTTGGSNDTLNVPITGYSNSAAGTGVGLPFGSGKAAIVLRSSDDLILGQSATLTANGLYNPATNDDRGSVDFDTSTTGGGDPMDVAIYLGSSRLDPPIGTVAVNSKVEIADNGSMVVDAGETVTFGGKFNESFFYQTNRLEVVSRKSNNLNEVIRYGRLPFAENPEAIRNWFNESTGYFAGAYVLRGVRTLLAEVLALSNPVPLVPPRTLEPEFRGEVEEPDTEGLIDLLSELGIGVQPYMTEAYADSLSTDLRLYKAAEKLQKLMPILEDADGTRIAALKAAVEQFFPTLDLLSEEQMNSFTLVLESHKGDGTDYDLAGQCIFALRDYVNILSTEIGWPVETSVEFVMGRYVPRITENDEIRIAVIQMHLQK